MLSKEENEIVTRVGPGTPMGNTLRRYWVPALLASEIPGPDCAPVRVRLLGEELSLEHVHDAVDVREEDAGQQVDAERRRHRLDVDT